jgi:hypothetical protein
VVYYAGQDMFFGGFASLVQLRHDCNLLETVFDSELLYLGNELLEYALLAYASYSLHEFCVGFVSFNMEIEEAELDLLFWQFKFRLLFLHNFLFARKPDLLWFFFLLLRLFRFLLHFQLFLLLRRFVVGVQQDGRIGQEGIFGCLWLFLLFRR